MCTAIVLVKLSGQLSGSTVCKGLLLVYASAIYFKAVMGKMRKQEQRKFFQKSYYRVFKTI